MGKCDVEQARVYVTTGKRYTGGNLSGIWMEPGKFLKRRDFLQACGELYADEDNPVFLFTDWQDIPRNYISDKQVSVNLFKMIRLITDLPDPDKIGFAIWLGKYEHNLPDIRADDILTAFRMCYQGYFGFRQKFTEYYAREELGITRQGSPRFDFVTFNDYLFKDLFVIDSGFVFRKVEYQSPEIHI